MFLSTITGTGNRAMKRIDLDKEEYIWNKLHDSLFPRVRGSSVECLSTVLHFRLPNTCCFQDYVFDILFNIDTTMPSVRYRTQPNTYSCTYVCSWQLLQQLQRQFHGSQVVVINWCLATVCCFWSQFRNRFLPFVTYTSCDQTPHYPHRTETKKSQYTILVTKHRHKTRGRKPSQNTYMIDLRSQTLKDSDLTCKTQFSDKAPQYPDFIRHYYSALVVARR